MSDIISQSAKLLPRAKRIKPVPGFATAYSFEPQTDDKDYLGNLYVVIEVLSNPKQAENVADLIIETIGNVYFDEKNETDNLLDRFELAVKTTNQALSKHAESGNATWVGRLSAIVAVIAGNELHISQSGSAEAYLYRGNITSHITSDLHDKGPHRPITTFANIASGQLEVHDRLLFATPALFHHIDKQRIKSILNDNSSTASIRKLSDLIDPGDADRIASIIVEVLTPELVALQVRNEEADEIEVGNADKPLELAKAVAVPAVKSLVSTSKSVGLKAAETSQKTVLPSLKKHGWKVAETLRQQLSSPLKRKISLGFLIALVLIIIGVLFIKYESSRSNANITKYHNAYNTYQQSLTAFQSGNKPKAIQLCAQALLSLNQLSQTQNEAALESSLSKTTHVAPDPASVPKLISLVNQELDQLNNIIRIQPTLLSSLTSFAKIDFTRIELIANKLYLFDNSSNPTIYEYDLNTKAIRVATSSQSGFGKVIATTVSSDGTGVYILTDQPAVWLLRASDNKLISESTNGAWVNGIAISSYANNLYILSPTKNQIYKYTPLPNGYNGAIGYITDATPISGTTSMAINGLVYLGGGTENIKQFLAGKLTLASSNLPSSLNNPAQIMILPNLSKILTLDSKSNGIGQFKLSSTSIAFENQLQLSSNDTIKSIALDPSSQTLYILTKSNILSFDVPTN